MLALRQLNGGGDGAGDADAAYLAAMTWAFGLQSEFVDVARLA